MTDTETAVSAAELDIGDFDAQDEAVLAVKKPKTGEPTTWVWTFYGPGHPKTIEVSDRVTRKFMNESRDKEQARVNGKKWKGDDQSAGELLKENVRNIVDRVKSFTPVNLNGKLIEFSPAAARELLLDRRKGWLLTQIMDYLRDDESFIQPSGKN